MAESLYLRLAGPLQSWAGPRVTGNVVRTEARPTRSGLEGLLAAAMGWRRGEWEEWIRDTSISVRSDRLGNRVDEFQTINPRDEDLEYQERAYLLMTGRRWSKRANFTPDGQNKTSIVNRTYIADAVFLVEVSDGTRLEQIKRALRKPQFTSYLGRKAFAPTFPFFLGVGPEGALKDLPTVKQTARAVQLSNDYFDALAGPERPQLRIDHLGRTGTHSPEFVNVEALPQNDWIKLISDTFDRT